MTVVVPLDVFGASATIAVSSDISVVGWALRVRLTAPMVTDLRTTLDADQTVVVSLPPSLIGKPYELHLIDHDQRAHLLAKGLLAAGPAGEVQTFVFDSSNDPVDEFETFVYDQLVPSDTWTIEHGLGRWPSVTVVDSAKTQVEGGVEYIDSNTVQITFSAPFSGQAFIGG